MTILSPQLGISPAATTGGETYDREVLKQFVKLGQDVRILLPCNKKIPPEVNGWKIDRTPFSHFVPPYTFNLFTIPWIFIKVEPWSPKVQPYQMPVIRIHSPEYLFPTGYFIKKYYPKIPVVAHYHLDQDSKLWTVMNRKLLNMVDAVIADSQYLKDRLVRRVGISKDKIKVIHCGVDVETIRPKVQSSRFKVQGSTRTVLFLGRFIERKRPDFALEVFAGLHRKHPDTKLVMIGEGPLEKKLKTQSAKLNISDAVEFPGPLFGKEKLKRYHQADLFLFPSEKEGFVLVVLEAMAAGLPLLVPNSLGFPEAVEDGGNGLLADAHNVDDWVVKAETILYSPQLQRTMKKRSRDIAVRKFSWELCAKRNLQVYEQAASRCSKRAEEEAIRYNKPHDRAINFGVFPMLQ